MVAGLPCEKKVNGLLEVGASGVMEAELCLGCRAGYGAG